MLSDCSRESSKRIPEATPCIALLPSRVFNTFVNAILLARTLVVGAYDDFVAFTTYASGVLPRKRHHVHERSEKADAHVCENDPVPEHIAWPILRAVDVVCYCSLQIAAVIIGRGNPQHSRRKMEAGTHSQTNCYPESECTFVRAFNITRYPCPLMWQVHS